MLASSALFYAFISGIFYVLATFAMKYWGGLPLLVLLPLAGTALCLAAIFEIEALKSAQMARTFVLILSFEFLLTFLCATLFLGEHYTMRDLVGLCLVFAGIVMLAARKDTAVGEVAAKGVPAHRTIDQRS
ncbi:MAG: hypothetical protein KDJ80_11125 [Nitratireductor sp.]|nr:hypothetical protein [Nitratireductor sp.]